MAPNNDASETAEESKGLVLRDLQSLLRQTMDPQVTVVDFQTTSLLQPGENHGGTLFKVEAVIKEDENSEERNLSLVAKMIPQTEFHKANMDLTASFVKEIFMFERLLPAYREIERECGIAEEDLIDILPKYYGGRLSLSKETPGESDDDSVLLMENLKVRGYYMADRKKGMDFEHTKLAIIQLARFHALGVVLKQRRPELYAECKKSIDVLPFKLMKLDGFIEHTIAEILKDPRIAKYEERIKTSIENSGGWEALVNVHPVEPWVSITHGDFWVNNMMFCKVNDDRTDVKFIDFQLARMNSPLVDLPYFLVANTDADVLDNHFQELLDIYYEQFVEVLRKMGCDVSPFTKRSFNEQLAVDGKKELFHCMMALKFFTLDADDGKLDMNDVTAIMFNDGNSLFLERAWLALSKFMEMGWV